MARLDSGYGWVIVLCCLYGHLTCIAAFFAFGVFFPVWVEDFNSSRGLASWAITLGFSINALVGPLVASAEEKFGHRKVIISGIVILSGAIFLSAFATSIYSLMVLIGVIGGVGIGMYSLPSLSIISLYFDKRRPLALANVMSGTALGNFLYPPFLTWLEDQMHWRGALIIMSGLVLQMAVFGALLRPADLYTTTVTDEDSIKSPTCTANLHTATVTGGDSDGPKKDKGIAEQSCFASNENVVYDISQDSVDGTDNSTCEHSPHQKQILTLHSREKPGPSCCKSWFSHLKNTVALLKNPFLAVFCVSNFLTFLTFLMVPLYMTDRAIENGVEKHEAALALSMYGAGNLFGRLGYGILADRCNVDAFALNSISLVVCGASTCLSPLCGGNVVLHGIYGFTFGTFIGVMHVLSTIILVELVGVSRLSSSLGVMNMFRAIGLILGTPVGGWIYDATGSYTVSFIIHGSIIGVSGLVTAGLKLAVARSKLHNAAAAVATTNSGVLNKSFVKDYSEGTPNKH
ncbi:monocarboxylate transporter 5 [Elysia marginata]|uniref:Monocarboxylate transporter 5 n=1 Tax=Elysia marginata TaxID=1093978 RepID=A0AAV4EH44_9GAST|nr:monocarboxylate transporter 5 [Elysia marginata]